MRALSLAFFLCISLIGFSQYTDPDLVGHWKFDGDFNDASSFANHGTATNVTLTTDRFGRPNSAGAFNGVDSQVEAPDHSSLDFGAEATFAAWVSMSSYVPARITDKQTAGGQDGYSFDVNAESSQTMAFRLVGGGVNCYSPKTLQLNTWYHLAAVYRNGTVSLYINGLYVSSQVGSTNTLSGNAYTFLIGAAHPNATKPGKLIFDGLIDDVRIYRRALSAKEVLFISRVL